MSMTDYLKRIQDYRDMEVRVLQNLDLESINGVMNVLEEARKSHRHIFICGNGGSAATASHYAGDFNKGVNMGLAGIDGHNLSDEKTSAEMMMIRTLEKGGFDNFTFIIVDSPAGKTKSRL